MGKFALLDQLPTKEEKRLRSFLDRLRKQAGRTTPGGNRARAFLKGLEDQEPRSFSVEVEREGKEPERETGVIAPEKKSFLDVASEFDVSTRGMPTKKAPREVRQTKPTRQDILAIDELRSRGYEVDESKSGMENLMDYHNGLVEQGRGEEARDIVNKMFRKPKKEKAEKTIKPDKARDELLKISEFTDIAEPTEREQFRIQQKMKRVPKLIEALPEEERQAMLEHFGLVQPTTEEGGGSLTESGAISLPPEVRTTSDAINHLTSVGMTREEAIEWLRSQ
jgi:hypothetical protein